VTIRTPEGKQAPPSLCSHVEIPAKTSGNRAIPGSLTSLEIAALLVSLTLFAAVWFGF
jgi:hypothetical protein